MVINDAFQHDVFILKAGVNILRCPSLAWNGMDTLLKPCKNKKGQIFGIALFKMLSVLARIVYQLTGLARAESLVVKRSMQ